MNTQELNRVTVVRNKMKSNNKAKKNQRVICMELDPAFITNNPTWQMMSLGEYLTQLQLADDTNSSSPMFRSHLRKELELSLGSFLLKTLGRTYGAALLPMLGSGSVNESIGQLSNKIANFLERCILPSEEEEKDKTKTDEGVAPIAFDPMSLDLSLIEIVSLLNVYQKSLSNNSIDSKSSMSPLVYLSRGENGAGEFAFDMGDGTFPTVFDMEKHFHKYVMEMELRIIESDKSYDPNDKSYSPPTPISQRLLPGLHLGKSPDVECTHSKREGIEHRLICVLLNKLCHNYHTLSTGSVNYCLTVICAGERCLFPEELLSALSRDGHTIEVCPRAMVTNFGMQLCVKEDDGSYTQIPTALFLNTGIERSTDGRVAYFPAPHGGMDLHIAGPIVGSGVRPAYLQFYVSKDGLTCFHPDEDQDTPWCQKTSLSDVYSPSDTARAVRLCAIVAVTFNRIATEFDLPFGGYGILGMCNDSATMIDYALRGTTRAYPLLSTGRYLNHVVQYIEMLMLGLSNNKSTSVPNLTHAIEDIHCLLQGTSLLPSDLHISPSTLISTSERHNSTYDIPLFQNTVEAKLILNEMATFAKKYVQDLKVK